jgi:hypothetical protein
MTSWDDLSTGPLPARIAGADIDALPSGGMVYGDEPNGRRRSSRLVLHRLDGSVVTFYRWRDADGDWFYPEAELMRRAGMSEATERQDR